MPLGCNGAKTMDTSRWAQLLVSAFPMLSSEELEIVDQPSELYNCIAYAAGDTNKWWWPDGINYWPPWATPDNRVESLKEAFAGLGYEECHNSDAEDGYQKVAFYEVEGEFQHAAVQTPDGRWRSKVGLGPLIEHSSPESLSGGMYGNATVYMRMTRMQHADSEIEVAPRLPATA